MKDFGFSFRMRVSRGDDYQTYPFILFVLGQTARIRKPHDLAHIWLLNANSSESQPIRCKLARSSPRKKLFKLAGNL